MYKGCYYNELDRVERKMKDLNYTPFEYLVLRLLILMIKIKLDSIN